MNVVSETKLQHYGDFNEKQAKIHLEFSYTVGMRQVNEK